MELHITLPNLARTEEVFAKFPVEARKAMAMTINEGIRKARTEIKKAIARVYNIQSGTVLGYLKKEFPAYASPGSLLGVLHVESERVLVQDFKAHEKKPAGTYFQEIRGVNSHMQHAFEAGMKSGHAGIFGRIDGMARLRIREISGDSIPQMLENIKTEVIWQTTVEEYVGERFEHQIDRLLA